MDREAFVKNIEETYKLGVDIIRKKNTDYAAGSDPFKNFKLFDSLFEGVDLNKANRVQLMIIVRVLDKISRICNLLGKDAIVVDESVDDSILDAINYLAILRAHRKFDDKKTPSSQYGGFSTVRMDKPITPIVSGTHTTYPGSYSTTPGNTSFIPEHNTYKAPEAKTPNEVRDAVGGAGGWGVNGGVGGSGGNGSAWRDHMTGDENGANNVFKIKV